MNDLSGGERDLAVDGRGHEHLHAAAAAHHAGLLHRLRQHTQRVVQGPLRLVWQEGLG